MGFPDPRATNYFSCLQCGSCASSCPATYAYYSDRAFEREFNPMRLVGLLRLNGSSPSGFPLERCFHCYSCKSVCRMGNSASDWVKMLREKKEGIHSGIVQRSLYEKGLSLTPELFSSMELEDWKDFKRILREMPSIRRELGLQGLHREIPEESLSQVREIVDLTLEGSFRARREKPDGRGPFRSGGIYLFRSCAMDTHYPGVNLSLKYVLDGLGVSYLEDEAQSTCGGFAYYADQLPFSTLLALNARNFALAESSGFPQVGTVCVTSYGVLMECWELLRGELREEVNEVLGRVGLRYRGGVRVYHLSEVLHLFVREIGSRVKFDFSGLRVATHHGCHYTKMFPEYATPNLLEDLVSATGARVVDYEEKNLCCGMGFKHTLEDRDYVRRITLRKLRSLKASGAQVVVHACPGCQLTLDRNQPYLEEKTDEEFGMVHLNYAQFLALAMGADPHRVVGIKTHSISPEPLLEDLGIL